MTLLKAAKNTNVSLNNHFGMSCANCSLKTKEKFSFADVEILRRVNFCIILINWLWKQFVLLSNHTICRKFCLKHQQIWGLLKIFALRLHNYDFHNPKFTWQTYFVYVSQEKYYLIKAVVQNSWEYSTEPDLRLSFQEAT